MKKNVVTILLCIGIIITSSVTISVNAIYCDKNKLESLKTEVNRLTSIVNERKDTINKLKNKGDALENEVLIGKTGYSKGNLITGKMIDISGNANGNKATIDSNYFKLGIKTNGYYDTNDYIIISYQELATMIGLDASKIKKGVTILGVTGTY